ncbi:gastrula zinc finger protein XlCGF26.1-like isoform X2 [Chironomus tepperi]|uniref:gastrula zinc finger protein XlCGF26.1-like isoform X2 n=1 Tax=Chironomus tepperi TaxID=113505 RepID=UPI00391FBEED
MDTCRLCNTSRNLNDLLKIENESLKIEKKLREMFNIELTSCSYTANNFCCRNCFKKLNNSHSFYLEIIENQKKFEAVSFEFNTVDVKVENFGDKNLNICEDIKVEKEENIEEDFGNSYDVGTFNDESNDLMEDNDDEHETIPNKYSKKTTSKKKKGNQKSKKCNKNNTKCKKTAKASKSQKASIKQEESTQSAPKEDYLDLIYRNENDCKFSDNFLQLSIHPTEMMRNGRLVPETELKYSALRWTNYNWKCTENESECKETFENIIELNSHLKSVHKSRYKNFCNQCGIISSNYPSFVTHTIKYHNTNARFSCIICSTIFWNLNDLFKHYKTDHSHRILMCLYCGLHFNTFSVLKTHLIQNHHHDDNRDVLFCDICNLSTKTKQNMIAHMKSHTTSTRLICDQCGAIFNRRAVLESHVNHIHKDKDVVAKCHCGKSFKNFERLRKHTKIVHQKHMTPHNFECTFCSKKFRTNYQLKCHLYSHDQNSSRYQCPHCDKAFRYSSGFQYHVRSAHTMEKPYGCPKCDLTFFDYANATKHVKGVHGGDFKPVRVS